MIHIQPPHAYPHPDRPRSKQESRCDKRPDSAVMQRHFRRPSQWTPRRHPMHSSVPWHSPPFAVMDCAPRSAMPMPSTGHHRLGIAPIIGPHGIRQESWRVSYWRLLQAVAWGPVRSVLLAPNCPPTPNHYALDTSTDCRAPFDVTSGHSISHLC